MEETPKERHNRELIELLNELRVALPGVQVLFAFLLTVPFSRGWPKVTQLEKVTFFVCLIATAISSALLIATPSIHRLRFRAVDKEKIVLYGNKLAIAGLLSLALAMVAALLLVTSFIFGVRAGAIAAGAFAVVVGTLWYGIAFRTKLEDES
jgi:uncharacterized protein DUF6328